MGLKSGSGSFYRHFNDKDALLEAIIEREITLAKERRAREQHGLDDPDQEIHEALTQQFRLTLDAQREKAELINLLSRAAHHFPNLIERLRKAFLEEATGSVARAYEGRIKRGEMVDMDPQVLSMLVSSVMLGIFYGENAFGKVSESVEDTLIQALVDLLVRKA